MNSELKPYAVYRESGVPWLGSIPRHWDLVPNRAVLRRRKLLVGSRHAHYQLLSLTKQGVIVRDVESGRGKFSSDMGTSQEVQLGDLVFCLFDVPETPRTVGLSHHHGMITGAYTVFQCSDPQLAAYLELYYRAMDDRKLLSPLYSGLRNTIPPTRFLSTKSPVPPRNEQTAIVRFLNDAEGKIRRYIGGKQRLIKLMEEQKQTIVHRAVTRGVDSDVRLKSSGLEWLGEVPTHWDTLRAKHVYTEIDVRSVTGSETHLSMSQKLGLVPSSMLQERAFHSESYIGGRLCDKGDLVLNRLKAHLGVFSVAQDSGLVSPDYSVYRLKKNGVPAYFEMVLRTPAIRRELRTRVRGIVEGLWRLYTPDFFDIRLPVPPPDEQERIVAFITNALRPLDDLIVAAQNEVALLREYRTRLIADVVTGKLDARAAAAGLPDGEFASADAIEQDEEPLDSEEYEHEANLDMAEVTM